MTRAPATGYSEVLVPMRNLGSARPPFALDRIAQVNPRQVRYRRPQPRHDDGHTAHSLTPPELLNQRAALASATSKRRGKPGVAGARR